MTRASNDSRATRVAMASSPKSPVQWLALAQGTSRLTLLSRFSTERSNICAAASNQTVSASARRLKLLCVKPSDETVVKLTPVLLLYMRALDRLQRPRPLVPAR